MHFTKYFFRYSVFKYFEYLLIYSGEQENVWTTVSQI